MPCVITDVAVSGAVVPLPSAQIVVSPLYAPFFEVASSQLRENASPQRVILTDASGGWSVTLPWPSESDPSTVRWLIRTPDGYAFTGTIPEGVAGPLTLHQLKLTYGWALAASTLQSVVAIQGPQPQLSTATPQPIGIAASGSSVLASRDDHVHALPNVGTAGTVGGGPQFVQSITTDAFGRVTSAVAGTPASGGVTSITAGAGLNGGVITTTGTISMPEIGPSGTVGGGTSFINSITLDPYGRVVSAIASVPAGGTGTQGGTTSTPNIPFASGANTLSDTNVQWSGGNLIPKTDFGTAAINLGDATHRWGGGNIGHMTMTATQWYPDSDGLVGLGGLLNRFGYFWNKGGRSDGFTATSTSYTIVQQNDYFILVDTTAGAVTIRLPSPATCAAGQSFVIINKTGTNAITIAQAGTEKINNSAANLTLTAGVGAAGSARIMTNQTDWFTY